LSFRESPCVLTWIRNERIQPASGDRNGKSGVRRSPPKNLLFFCPLLPALCPLFARSLPFHRKFLPALLRVWSRALRARPCRAGKERAKNGQRGGQRAGKEEPPFFEFR
jgi:hypothetical protein